MPVITAFQAANRTKTRFVVSLDNVEWAELDVETIVLERLERGETLDEARQVAIFARDERIRARKAAAASIARAPKTRRELSAALRQKGFGGAAIDEALDALTASGTLDEQAVAERHAKRRRRAAYGPRRIEAELRQRGVNGETAARMVGEASAGADLNLEALELARKQARKYAPLSDFKQRQKLTAWLARRGYAGDVAIEAVRRLCAEQGERDDEAGEES